MPVTPITSDRLAPPVGPFSPAVRDGERVYTSGQVAQDPATGRLIAGGVAAQTEQIAKHIAPPYPARTTVAAAALPLGAQVEMETIAG